MRLRLDPHGRVEDLPLLRLILGTLGEPTKVDHGTATQSHTVGQLIVQLHVWPSPDLTARRAENLPAGFLKRTFPRDMRRGRQCLADELGESPVASPLAAPEAMKYFCVEVDREARRVVTMERTDDETTASAAESSEIQVTFEYAHCRRPGAGAAATSLAIAASSRSRRVSIRSNIWRRRKSSIASTASHTSRSGAASRDSRVWPRTASPAPARFQCGGRSRNTPAADVQAARDLIRRREEAVLDVCPECWEKCEQYHRRVEDALEFLSRRQETTSPRAVSASQSWKQTTWN